MVVAVAACISCVELNVHVDVGAVIDVDGRCICICVYVCMYVGMYVCT